MRFRLPLAFAALLLLVIPAHAWLFTGARVGGYGGAGGSQTIASVGPSTGSFVADSSVGTAVATLATVMSPSSPAFAGSYAFSTTQGPCNGTNGADNGSFTVNASSGAVTVGAPSLAAGTYRVCAIASQGGITNSPQGVAMTVTAIPAGIALLQSNSGACGEGPVTSCAVTLPSVGAAHWLAVWPQWCSDDNCDTVGVEPTLTDSSNQPCTKVPNTFAGKTAPVIGMAELWSCPDSVSSTGTDTFTFHWSSAANWVTAFAAEYSGIATSGTMLEGAAVANGQSSTPAVDTAAATTNSGELIFSAINPHGTVTAAQTQVGSTNGEYQVAGSPNIYANNWTCSNCAFGAFVVAVSQTPIVAQISNVALSNSSVGAGNVSGSAIGTASVSMSLGATFTGSYSIVSSGTDHAGTTCTSTNATNFQVNSSTGALATNTSLAAGTYPGVCIEATEAGVPNSPYIQAFTVTSVTQSIASVSPSTGNFPAGSGAGTVAAILSAAMSPASPSFGGTFALSTTQGPCNSTNGANNGLFHVVGSNLELLGTEGAGTYQACVIAQQTGATNTPQGVAITITGTTTPSDTMTVADDSGTGATNYPLQIGRPAIEGEFPSGTCPQITYMGSQIPTQADVKNRFPDGSIKFEVISAVLPSVPAAQEITTSAAGSGTTLTFASAPGAWAVAGLPVADGDRPGAIAAGATISSVSGDTIVISSSAASVQSGDAIQFGGETISFAPTTSGSPATNDMTATSGSCADSVALTTAQMENSSYNFDSQVAMSSGVGPSGGTISARTMLSNAGTCSATNPMSSLADCKLWTLGGVAQTIILRDDAETSTCPGDGADSASKYDVGFGSASQNVCPVRPEFEATFWPTTHQVWFRYVSDTGMYNAYADAPYVVTITAGNTSPTQVFQYDLSMTGNGLGQGITGLSANQTVNSTYTGTLAIAGSPSSSLTVGDQYTIRDNNTGEWFVGQYNSSSQVTIPNACDNASDTGSCRGVWTNNSFAITSGDTLTVSPSYMNAIKEQWAGTDWTQQYWLGGTPNSEINIDYNLAYLDWTHYIENYDPAVRMPLATLITASRLGTCQTGLDGYMYVGYDPWYASCAHSIYDGHYSGGIIDNEQEDTGGRPDIAPQPGWYAWWLNSGNWRERQMALYIADDAASFAWHLIATDPTKKLLRGDAAGTGLGLPATLEGNPSLYSYDSSFPWTTGGGPNPNDAPMDSSGAWNRQAPFTNQIRATHAADWFHVPYILTGDPWYLREEDEATTWYNASTGYGGGTRCRGPCDAYSGQASTYMGIMAGITPTEPRGIAWPLRNDVWTALDAPDGDPQTTYFLDMANDALASIDGSFNIGSSSPYYNTPVYNYFASNGSSAFCNGGVLTLGAISCAPNIGSGYTPACAAQSQSYDETWENNFAVGAAADGAEIGFPSSTADYVGQFPLGLVNNTGYPKLVATYQVEVDNNSFVYWPTWASFINNIQTGTQGPNYLTGSPPFTSGQCGGMSLPDWWSGLLSASGSSYIVNAEYALAPLVDVGASGASAAWSWYDTNAYAVISALDSQNNYTADTSWDIIPRPSGNAAPLPALPTSE